MQIPNSLGLVPGGFASRFANGAPTMVVTDLARYVCGAPADLAARHTQTCFVCGWHGAQLTAAFRLGVAVGAWDPEGFTPAEAVERERDRIERGRLW